MSRHNKRVATDPEYQFVSDAVAYRQELSNREAISLNRETRLSEKEDNNRFWLSLENRKRVAQGLPEVASLDELTESDDSATKSMTDDLQIVKQDPDTEEAQATAPTVASRDADTSETNATAATNEVATADETGTEVAKEEETPPDVYIREAGNVLLDIMALSTRTAENGGTKSRSGFVR